MLAMIHVTHINDTSKNIMISSTYPPPPSPPWVIHGMYLPCIAGRDVALDTQTTHTEIFLNFLMFLDTITQKDYILLLRSHKTMKLTESMLRKIIKEELKNVLNKGRAKVKTAAPPAPTAYSGDTLLVYQTDDGYVEYYVGSQDNIDAFVAGETGGEPTGLTSVSIGNQRAWDNHMNGGPHPVTKWLKKHGSIKKILDQEYPDPFGANEYWGVADWIEEHTEEPFDDGM